MTSQDISEHPRTERSWLVPQILDIGWNMLLNIRFLKRFVAFFRVEPFSEIWRYNPRFAIKFLGHNYLARNLDARAGMECFLYHYCRMYSSFPDRVLKMILYWDIPLYGQTADDGHRFSLDLGASRPYDKEGELALLFKVDALIIFNLTFTIVPGAIVGSNATEVLLLSRIQGERRCPEEIRLATKAMCDVRPRAVLFAALQGIAQALGVKEIDAVEAVEQSSHCESNELTFQNSYDNFFNELGLQKNWAGFYHGHVPIPEKPLQLIEPKYRRNARKKQAFKALIRQMCAESMYQALGGKADHLESSDSLLSEQFTLASRKIEERGTRMILHEH